MSKPIILNNDYALTKEPEGWHIYGYIHSEDIPLGCVKDKFAGSVTLDTDAAMILLDAICSELGGCDVLKDAYADINAATVRAEAAEAERDISRTWSARWKMAAKRWYKQRYCLLESVRVWRDCALNMTTSARDHLALANNYVGHLMKTLEELLAARADAERLAGALCWALGSVVPPSARLREFMTDEAKKTLGEVRQNWMARYNQARAALAAHDAVIERSEGDE